MSKKKFLVSAALIMLVILSACSSLSLPFASTSASPTTSAASTAQSAVASKLGPGILSLEGTSQAITVDQANSLLFLWKGVKSLTADQSSSKFELAALYTQIEQSLTAEQVQAINQVSLTQAELSALQAKFGAQLAQGGAPTGATTTRSSSSSSSQSSGGFDGGPGGGPGGGGPGGSDLAILNGNTSLVSSTTATQTPPKTTSATTAKPAVDLNAMFANAVISLLQQKAG